MEWITSTFEDRPLKCRIDLVSDCYPNISIKEAEREAREQAVDGKVCSKFQVQLSMWIKNFIKHFVVVIIKRD